MGGQRSLKLTDLSHKYMAFTVYSIGVSKKAVIILKGVVAE